MRAVPNVNTAAAKKVLLKNKIRFINAVAIFKEPKSKQRGDKELMDVVDMVRKHSAAIVRITSTERGVFLDDVISIKILFFLRELGDWE